MTALNVTATPYSNPDAAIQGRRLTPATIDGILRATASGVPQGVVARSYSVSPATVFRVVERFADDPRLTAVNETISELADAERELLEALGDVPSTRQLIELVRAGHLLRRDRERRAANR